MTPDGDDEGKQPEILYSLRAVRDSPDLGVDRGTVCHVIDARPGVGLVLWVPSMDMTIVTSQLVHPDLELIPEQLPLPRK